MTEENLKEKQNIMLTFYRKQEGAQFKENSAIINRYYWTIPPWFR